MSVSILGEEYDISTTTELFLYGNKLTSIL